MSKPTPEEVEHALDHQTLLPDENPNSPFIDDALHWILVYSELLQFKDSMLAMVKVASDGLTDAARQDIAIDEELLRAQAERYRVRSAFWYERARVLSDGDPQTELPEAS